MGQGSLPSAEGLNAQELAGNGVRVDTLKALLVRSAEEETSEDAENKTSSDPPKLISLDQVTVRGEDLTGKFLTIVPEADPELG